MYLTYLPYTTVDTSKYTTTHSVLLPCFTFDYLHLTATTGPCNHFSETMVHKQRKENILVLPSLPTRKNTEKRKPLDPVCLHPEAENTSGGKKIPWAHQSPLEEDHTHRSKKIFKPACTHLETDDMQNEAV